MKVDEEEKTSWVCCWLVNFIYKTELSFFSSLFFFSPFRFSGLGVIFRNAFLSSR